MNNVLQFLAGKKTYFIALITIAIGMYMENPEMVLMGLAFAGLRNAIK